MIRWCSYCQTFMGLCPPLAQFVLTHGVCQECKKGGLSKLVKRQSTDVELVFLNFEEKIRQGIFVEPVEIIKASKNLDLSIADLLLGVLQPLLWQVGQCFEEGSISVEKEHLFTQSVYSLLNITRDEQSQRDYKVVLFPADENQHTLGLEFLKKLLISEVQIVSIILKRPPLSSDDYRSVIEKYNPILIGVSIAMPEQMIYIESLLQWHDKLQTQVKKPLVMVGGSAVLACKNILERNLSILISDPTEVKEGIDAIAGLCSEKINSSKSSSVFQSNPFDLGLRPLIARVGNTLKILFLDDEVDLCELFFEEFSSEAIQIKLCNDPNTAIEESINNHYDIIFLDYRLPYTSGDQVAQAMPAHITKYLITGDVFICPVYKFKAIIYKPWNTEQIRNLLQLNVAQV